MTHAWSNFFKQFTIHIRTFNYIPAQLLYYYHLCTQCRARYMSTRSISSAKYVRHKFKDTYAHTHTRVSAYENNKKRKSSQPPLSLVAGRLHLATRERERDKLALSSSIMKARADVSSVIISVERERGVYYREARHDAHVRTTTKKRRLICSCGLLYKCLIM